MKLIAFDIEIAKSIPEDATDWRDHRPLGISCAVTWMQGEDEPVVWYGRYPYTEERAIKMLQGECQLLVNYLYDTNAVPVTWNGLSFDFDILAEESGMHDKCKEMARYHYDMMFQLFCKRGHYLGLDKACQGAGIEGKTEGVSGADAPQMWRDGKFQQVIDYCTQDVRATLDLALWVQRNRCITWTANSGRQNTVKFPAGLETVGACLTYPLPNTSWMDNPPTRESFYQWFFKGE